MSRTAKSCNNASKASSGLVLNSGESLQAPKTLDFGGISLLFFILYKRFCPSVGPLFSLSVHPSVRPSVLLSMIHKWV